MKTILHYLRPGKNCVIDIHPGTLEEVPCQNNSYIFRNTWPSDGYNKSEDYIQIRCTDINGDSLFKLLLTYEQAKGLKKALNNSIKEFKDD